MAEMDYIVILDFKKLSPKTYRKMKKAERDREFRIGEMMFYDELCGD